MTRRILQIDPMPACNLRCPLCETGNGTGTRRAPRMTLAELTAVLDQAAGFSEVHLFNRGESLLHPEIVEMIRACRERGLAVALHSNLNVPEERLVAAVENGLGRLSASIDGVSQQAYAAYRRRGSVERALANLETAAALQEERPFTVSWQFLVHRRNEHELAAARELALSLGVAFLPLPIGVGEDVPDLPPADLPALAAEWAARENPWAVRAAYGGLFPEPRRERGEGCHFLDSAVTVHPDLAVGPCCMTVDPASDFGSLRGAPLAAVLDNARFRAARALFRTDLPAAERTPYGAADAVVCARCTVYRDFLDGLDADGDAPPSPPPRADLERLVADPELADRLLALADPAFRERVAVAAETSRAATASGLAQTVPGAGELPLAARLAVCHGLLFHLPEPAMWPSPGLALLILGSGALLAEGPGSDLELMACALEPSPELADRCLPGLLGLAVAAGLRVDPWCAANVLLGRAVQTPAHASLESQLDAPVLRGLLRERPAGGLALAVEPVFCDLFGRVVAGHSRVARSVRRRKIALLREHLPFVLAAAAELARWNLERGAACPARHRAASRACLEIALGLGEPAWEERLLRAVEDPGVLFAGAAEGADLPLLLERAVDRLRRVSPGADARELIAAAL